MATTDDALVTKRPSGLGSLLRSRIVDAVHTTIGGGKEELRDYVEPAGDVGLLGPDSPAWKVHADLASMLYGGFAALMLQTLHPRAMAGVAQHSNYRNDPTGRLRRTARFVAGTTYGSTLFADRLFEEVLHVHRRVKGLSAEGLSYSANDPDLLTWVHVTEVRHFLSSYLLYTGSLSEAEQNRYYFDTSVIPARLGAVLEDVPRSTMEVERYIEDIRGELRATPEALDAVKFLRRASIPAGEGLLMTKIGQLSHFIVVGAAIDLLPDFARRELHLHRLARLKSPLRRLLGRSLAVTLRWGLGPSAVVSISIDRIARGERRVQRVGTGQDDDPQGSIRSEWGQRASRAHYNQVLKSWQPLRQLSGRMPGRESEQRHA